MMDERLCSAYFEAVHAGDVAGQEAAIGRLYPSLQGFVLNACKKKWGNLLDEAGLGPEDVLQHVASKLLGSSAPARGVEGAAPHVALQGWVLKVCFHFLVWQQRKVRRSGVRGEPLEQVPGPAQVVSGGPGDRPEYLRDVEALGEMLKACYPRCLPLYALGLQLGEEPGAARAAQLGISPDNLYQVRSRMKRYLDAFRALEPDPHVTDEEVTREMGVASTGDSLRIVAAVRRFLVQRRMEVAP